jgi:hypothetical protein
MRRDTLVVRARNLPRKTPALLRLQEPHELKVGTRLRVLNGALARGHEDDAVSAIVRVD